jgi:hypothetical protein
MMGVPQQVHPEPKSFLFSLGWVPESQTRRVGSCWENDDLALKFWENRRPNYAGLELDAEDGI